MLRLPAMDILVHIQHSRAGAFCLRDKSVVPSAGRITVSPPICRCSPEGVKSAFAVVWWGVDTRWQAAQSKDPSVVLQGDYAASDALPIAL